MKPGELDSTVNNAQSLARAWQDRANELLTSEERGIQEQMKRLMTHPIDKAVLTKMIDQSFRTRDNSRVADQVNAILTSYGIPDFFPRVDRLLIQMFLARITSCAICRRGRFWSGFTRMTACLMFWAESRP